MASQNKSTTRRSYKIMVLLMLMTWGAVAFDYYDRRKLSGIGEQRVLMWWETIPNMQGRPRARVIVDGHMLLSYQFDYQLAVICYHPDPTKETLDKVNLQKSSLYDIRDGHISISFDLNDEFVQEFKNGLYYTVYKPLLVPKSIKMEHFLTMREARDLGVILLRGASGVGISFR